MARITLYGPRQAPFVIKVQRALGFKGLAHELVEPQSTEDYRRWNPETGLLPVIDIDGERTPDSTAILVRLDELFPDPPLASPDPKVAEAQRRLEDWCDESFFFYYLRWLRIRGGQAAPVKESRRSRWLARLGLRPGKREDSGERSRQLATELARRLDDLVVLLGGRKFFHGDQPSMGDFAVYAMLVSMRANNLPNGRRLLAERPALLDFMKRVEQASGG